MIENIKIGCTISKDQIMLARTEDIDAASVLDAINFDAWFVEYTNDEHPTREEFDDYRAALDRYDELKTWDEFDVMSGLIGSIRDYATWREVSGNV